MSSFNIVVSLWFKADSVSRNGSWPPACPAAIVHCRHRPGSTRRFGEQRVGVDRRAPPPLLLGAELEDREMQVRRFDGGVAGAADIADRVAGLQGLALAQGFGIAVEVGVVVGVAAGEVELVD